MCFLSTPSHDACPYVWCAQWDSLGETSFLSLYLEAMSILEGKVCFLVKKQDGSYFQIQSIRLCLSMNWGQQCWELPMNSVYWFLMFYCYSLDSSTTAPLWFTCWGLYILCVFLDVVNFFRWSFPSSIFCRAGVVNWYCLHMVLSRNIFFLHPLWLIVLLVMVV